MTLRPTYQTDFYPRPPRGGRHNFVTSFLLLWFISIHALREEGDYYHKPRQLSRAGISIHALREEGDSARTAQQTGTERFLSTPSARRATSAVWQGGTDPGHFYPRPPRGGRRGRRHFLRFRKAISIHALREEGDPNINGASRFSSLFLSTPSARRATNGCE